MCAYHVDLCIYLTAFCAQASYNAERTVDNEADETKASDTTAINRPQLQDVQLDSLLADYKETIRRLEQEVEALGGDPSSLGRGRTLQQLEQELYEEKSAKIAAEKGTLTFHSHQAFYIFTEYSVFIALHEAEQAHTSSLDKIEELEQTLFELQGEIGAGRHVPPGLRILSLRDNPAQQWADLSQAAMDRLKSENAALLNRLKELEDSRVRSGPSDGGENEGRSAGQGGSEELVPRASYEVVHKEKTDLEAELKAKEKRLLRLQQVFQAKSAEFREAIASILGVKLAFYPNGQVRVTSQFDLNAAFVFQPAAPQSQQEGGGGMKMQLVAQGEGGPEDLPQLMRYWVEQEQCIPGFLASVTLQCYEKRKIEQEQEGRVVG